MGVMNIRSTTVSEAVKVESAEDMETVKSWITASGYEKIDQAILDELIAQHVVFAKDPTGDVVIIPAPNFAADWEELEPEPDVFDMDPESSDFDAQISKILGS